MSETTPKNRVHKELIFMISEIVGNEPGEMEIKSSPLRGVPGFGNSHGGKYSIMVNHQNGDLIHIDVVRPVKYPREFTEWCNSRGITHKEGIEVLSEVARKLPQKDGEIHEDYQARIRASLPRVHIGADS